MVSSSLDAFSGSLALREKPSASDYEKLPGAPSFGAVELFSAALDEDKPDRNGPTTPVKQRLFEPDLPPYSPQYVPKPSPVSDDESVARRAFPFLATTHAKLHIKPRPKTWSGVRVRVFGDMAARELLTGAFRAEDRRSKSALSAWKAVKKRVHGDMAARELLMGAYRPIPRDRRTGGIPMRRLFSRRRARRRSLSVRESITVCAAPRHRRDVVPISTAARWRGGRRGDSHRSPGAMSPPNGVAPYGHTPAKPQERSGLTCRQDQAAAKVQARIRGRNAREPPGDGCRCGRPSTTAAARRRTRFREPARRRLCRYGVNQLIQDGGRRAGLDSC